MHNFFHALTFTERSSTKRLLRNESFLNLEKGDSLSYNATESSTGTRPNKESCTLLYINRRQLLMSAMSSHFYITQAIRGY